MKSYLYNDVWPLIPSEWRDVIKEVKKYSKIYNTSAQVENDVLTNEKIWLPSTKEVFGAKSGGETLGPHYAFAFIDDSARIRKIGSSNSGWFLRSAHDAGIFVCVYTNGAWHNNTASNNYGVDFGYCT